MVELVVASGSCLKQLAVGTRVGVVEPSVFLFQRDFFTVCFSSTHCVEGRHFCMHMHLSITEAAGPQIQFMVGVTLWSFTNCLPVFTSLLLSFCVHSYEDY